jgi:hypothetical protein
MSTLPISHFPHGEPPYQPHLWNNLSHNLTATHNCYAYMLNDLYQVPRIFGKPQPGYFDNNNNEPMSRHQRLSCKEVVKGVKDDNPHIKRFTLKKGKKYRCKSNYYKGFMMVSPGNDYHFARQDNRMLEVFRCIHKDIETGKITLSKTKSKNVKLFLSYCKKYIPNIVALAKTQHKNINNEAQFLKMIDKYSKVWSHKPGGTASTDKDASGNLIINPEEADWNYNKKGGINYSVMCCYFSIPSNNVALTYSSGIPHDKTNNSKNNPHNIRADLSVNHEIDSKYEKLLKEICRQ